MRSVPNMTIAAPANEAELKEMMYTALLSGVPFAIRYPRGRGIGPTGAADSDGWR